MKFDSGLLITIWLFGGLAIFIYGMQIASEGLQRVAGSKLRDVLNSMVRNRLAGVIVGVIVTVMVQSSSATTVMLIGFVNASLMTLRQTIGVILGAGIGTTVTVQLIAFKLSDFSPLLVAIGFLMTLNGKNHRLAAAGRVVMGFGFVFLGMYMMGATKSLADIGMAREMFAKLGHHPILGVLVATAFTAVIQSSAATIGMAMSLSAVGIVSIESAIPIMLGANIGTCATALLASIGGTRTGLRVALSHTMFKVIGVLLFLPFIHRFGTLMGGTSADVARQVANAHTVFNIVVVVVCLPFVGFFVKFIERMAPDPPEKMPDSIKHLDPILLKSPEMAIGQAGREILSIADKIQKLMDLVPEVFLNGNESVIEEIGALEDEVDVACRQTILYLTKLSQKDLAQEQSLQITRFLFIADEMEHIGDNIESILRQGRKKIARNFQFSREGEEQLKKMYEEVKNLLLMAINSFVLNDRDMARKVYKSRERVREMHRDFNLAHFQRLMDSRQDSIESSSVHLDILDRMERVNVHVTRIAHIIMDENHVTPSHHV